MKNEKQNHETKTKTYNPNQNPQNKLLPRTHHTQIHRIQPRLRHRAHNQEHTIRVPDPPLLAPTPTPIENQTGDETCSQEVDVMNRDEVQGWEPGGEGGVG
jgi:hypothetical protein